MCKGYWLVYWKYGIAGIHEPLNLQVTSLHEAFEACCEKAPERGMRVTGSKLVGLVPKT